MTSASSSTEIKKADFLPLFGITLKQKWTTMLLMAIILFFALPVPVLMMLSSILDSGDPNRYSEALVTITEWSQNIRFLLIPLMSILAVVIVCAMMRYLTSKVSVDFYHSLPIKRSRLYINQLLAGWIILIVPFLLMLSVTLIICAANGVIDSGIIYAVLITLGEAIVYSLLFFGLSALIGMVSGVTAVHLVLTCTAVFIIPLIYISVIYFISIFNENMWVDWYVNRGIASRLSPALRFVLDEDPLRTGEVIVYLIIAAAFLIGGYFIYTRRKSERAGTSIVFTPLGEVIKYLLIFPMTLLGGLLFYLIMERFFWTIFGMACGALLTFMLSNTILHKTAKAMFRGWKGLCIYGAVIALCMVALMTNLFGLNTNIPKAGNLSRVEMMLDNNTELFRYEDDEVMAAIRTLYTDGEWRSDAYIYGYYPYDSDVFTATDLLKLNIVFYPKVGLPRAKTVVISNKTEFIEQLRIILDSDEFKRQYIDMIRDIDTLRLYLYMEDFLLYSPSRNGGIYYDPNYSNSRMEQIRKTILPVLLEDAENVGYDYFQRTNLGNIRFRSGSTSSDWCYIPVMPGSEELGEFMLDYDYTNNPIDEQLEIIAGAVENMTITERESDKELTFTDPAQIYEILKNVTALDDSNNDLCLLTVADTQYYITYSLRINDGRDDEQNINTYYEDYFTHFIYDKVPGFVAAAFAK